jgi:uncharacterized protein
MDAITDMLRKAQTIAVVGLSDREDRPSYGVAKYLRDAGYHIIPVNPNISEWEGIPALDTLRDLKEPVDIVDVFRRPEYVPAMVDDAIAAGARVVWLQQGITHDAAARKAEEAGLEVIQDQCLAVAHSLRKKQIKEDGAW